MTTFEYLKIPKVSYCTSVLFKDTGGNMIAPELMGNVAIPYNRKAFVFHRGCSFNIKSILETELIAG